MPCFNAGTFSLSIGKVEASDANRRQYEETKANWIIVKVAGLSKALRMDLADVLVNADEAYHSTHSIYEIQSAFIAT